MIYKFIFLFVYLAIGLCQEVLTQPEQVHLSYGALPDQMVVTWVTINKTQGAYCQYGFYDGEFKLKTAKGSSKEFVDGGDEKRRIFIHRVQLKDLIPNQKYGYRVGTDEDGWSNLYFFRAMRGGEAATFGVVGDMGNINGKSVVELQKLSQSGAFDAVIHVGDFAYDMDTDNGRVGDAYMKQAESFAAYVPYMTCVGNHEQKYNFSNYKNRFSMPGGDGESMFYSVNIGPMHLVAFSSEFYYFPKYGWRQIERQYDWLKKDLMEANKPENRAKRPWLVTMCHRPLYCSNANDHDHCNKPDNLIRVGFPHSHAYGIEDLLYNNKVDLHFQAHEHSYERMWPVYNTSVCKSVGPNPYKNPRAPVHIVTGSGGCKEGLDPFVKSPQDWSAFHADDYGFSILKIHNRTHMSFDQISVDKDNKVIDSIMIEKDESAVFDCHLQAPPTNPFHL